MNSSIQRMAFLFRLQWNKHWKKYFIYGLKALAIMFGIQFVVSLGGENITHRNIGLILIPFHYSAFNIYMSVMLFVALDYTFNDLKNSDDSIPFIGLPAKAWEKYIIEGIYLCLLTPLFIFIGYFLYESLGNLVFHSYLEQSIRFKSLNWEDICSMRNMLIIWIILSLLLPARVCFRSGAYPKMILSTLLVFLLFILVGFLLFRAFNGSLFDGPFDLENYTIIFPDYGLGRVFPFWKERPWFIVTLIISVISWTMGILKLKEREVV